MVGTAVVTGAGQGLGRAIARRLSDDGFSVVALDIDGQHANDTADLVSGQGYQCDVRDLVALGDVAQEVGPVQVLVNNAGIWRVGSLLSASQEEISDVLGVNLLGTVNCCQAFVPSFVDGGTIVNVSSAAAAMRTAGVGIYPSAKGAIEILTMQLAGELGPRGIRVNAIAPGLILTAGTAENYQGDRGTQRAASVPLRRIGETTDIANVVSFLSSEQSSYVSGQIIAVDGGLTASRPGA